MTNDRAVNGTGDTGRVRNHEGDGALATTVRELVGTKHPVIAAATITPRGMVAATLGTGFEADFEIGSIAKGVTGLLYADAVDRREVEPSTTLGTLLPLGNTPTSTVTLASLAMHHAGLPRLAPKNKPLRKTIDMWRHGWNPYGETLDELINQARNVKLGKPRAAYSNLGYMLLGHAVARAASTTYAHLVSERITKPLGLTTFYVPATPDDIGAQAATGTNRSGRPQQPWTGEALGPAGGIRATISAMAGLTAALLDGSAPGVTALDPVTQFTGRAVKIGAAWITLDHKGRSITWHNGGTGGFRSWIGLDRTAGTGAVLLSATSPSVDRHGFDLLARLSDATS